MARVSLKVRRRKRLPGGGRFFKGLPLSIFWGRGGLFSCSVPSPNIFCAHFILHLPKFFFFPPPSSSFPLSPSFVFLAGD